MSRGRQQVIGGRSPHKRTHTIEWCDGWRKGQSARTADSCHYCGRLILSGERVGRYPYPKRVAHWICVTQLREDQRVVAPTCHTCGKPSSDRALIRGRYRPVCPAHAP